MLLTGCGSSGAGDATRPTSSSTQADASSSATTATEPATEPAAEEVTIARQPFCDGIDAAAFVAALGVEGRAGLLLERRPGEKYEVFPGEPKATSTSWSCHFQTSAEPRFALSLAIRGADMREPEFEREVDGMVERMEDSPGTAGRCEESEAPEYGELGRALACSRREVDSRTSYVSGYANAFYLGLLDDAYISCGVYGATPRDLPRALKAATVMCPEALEAMSG